MKIRYVCETCGGWSYAKEDTIACEARGLPAYAAPPGMIYDLGLTSDGWTIIAVLAKIEHARGTHLLDTSAMVFRDRPNGPFDNNDTERCDTGFWVPEDGGRPDHRWRAPDQQSPAFKRALAWSRRRFVATIYNPKTHRAEPVEEP